MFEPYFSFARGIRGARIAGAALIVLCCACGGDDGHPAVGSGDATAHERDASKSGEQDASTNKPKDASTSTPPHKDAASSDPDTGDDGGTPSSSDSDAAAGGNTGATGPDDGDPSAPTVAIDGIACGDSSAGFGLGTANLKVTNRDVILTYPCNKHEGANVTFILLLHGTNPNEATKTYTHAYFAAHTLTNSHNLIIAEPKSLASQWGNTTENPDASQDKQHLLDVIDYVYTNFSKFHINSTWIAGHSWGAIYAKQFVCDTTVQDKVRGVLGMSGGAAPPGLGFGSTGGNLTPTTNCTSYISQIHTVGDMDMVTGLPDQSKPAASHECDAKTAPTDLDGQMQMAEDYPNCDPGWVHEQITMGNHMHTTAINADVVQHIVEQIKAGDKY